ncbi:MAG TPA: hypothetical protein VGL38_06820 [bacterium]|jgi:hypothetical protein
MGWVSLRWTAGIALCWIVGTAKAETRLCPVTFYFSASQPVTIVNLAPNRDYWRGSYGIEGGIEIPLSPHRALRLEGTYDRFGYHSPDFDPYRHSGPSRFASAMADLMVSFAHRSSAVRPYMALGLGGMWGTVTRPVLYPNYPYDGEDCRGAYGAGAGNYRGISARAGLGVSLPMGERLAWFAESDVTTLLLGYPFDEPYSGSLDVGFAGLRLGISVQ